MTDTTVIVPTGEPSSYIDWSPIIGGALLASACAFVLFTFGAAAGVASVSPYSFSNPSATAISAAGAFWVLVVMIGTSMLGGFFAGRFRRPQESLASDEHEARDGAHGLLVWALGIALGVFLAGMSVSSILRGATSAAGGVGQVAGQSLSSDQVRGAIDRMAQSAGQTNVTPNENSRQAAARILSNVTARGGTITPEDRAYLARIVSVEAGVPEEEARKRVEAAIEQTKAAADKARKAIILLAFLVGAGSIVSAGAAYWAGTAGGSIRDKRSLAW